MIQLRDWQRGPADRIHAALEGKKFCVAACCTGSGKTYLALDCARRIGGRWLVVAPKATLTQWNRVAEGFGLSGLVHCVNPERISTFRSPWYDGEKWKLPPDTAGVVVDEFHKGCSGMESKFTLAVARLKAYRVRGLFMSATPAVSPLQMRAITWWGGVCAFDRSSFLGWCRRNGVSEVYINDRRTWQFTKSKARGQAIMAEIRAGFGGSFITLRQDEIPGFPTETADIAYLDVCEKDRATVDKAYTEMSDRLKSKPKDWLAQVGRERERIEFVLAEPLAERVAAGDEDVSVVVFWNFTEPRLRFEKKLKELTGEAVASIYGGQDEDERQAGIDAFMRDEVRFQSVMAAAGGAGISLHGMAGFRPRESYIVPSYSASELKQCFGRIRRDGGSHATQHLVVATGTVQERVIKALEGKLDNLEALCDGDLVK